MILRRLIIVFSILGTSHARAALYSTFGLGGESSGRVSSVTASADNPYAALYNPALLAFHSGSHFAFSTFGNFASWEPLRGVQPSPSQAAQDMQLTPLELVNWSLGFGHPFTVGAGKRRAGIGVTISGPFNRLRSFSAGSPYDFYSLHYGTADSQFKATAGAAIELIQNTLSFGAGVSFYLSGAGNAEAALIAKNPTAKLGLDVGLNSALNTGLYFHKERTSASLVFRQEINPSYQQRFTGYVEQSGATVLQQPFLVRTTLYYEPHTLESDLQYDLGPLTASVGASYQVWSRYQPSFLLAETVDADGNPKRTVDPGVKMRNTLSPRASVDVPLFGRTVHLGGGYQYRPSPVADLSGDVNVIDSDAHIVGLSISHQIPESWLSAKVSWSLFGQYHFLTRREVVKSSATWAGAPRFEISGRAYTIGLLLQADL
jgi:hypothetical protein